MNSVKSSMPLWKWILLIVFGSALFLFLDLQKPYSTIYHIVSEGLFAIWLIHIVVIRKKYFRISAYQKRIG